MPSVSGAVLGGCPHAWVADKGRTEYLIPGSRQPSPGSGHSIPIVTRSGCHARNVRGGLPPQCLANLGRPNSSTPALGRTNLPVAAGTGRNAAVAGRPEAVVASTVHHRRASLHGPLRRTATCMAPHAWHHSMPDVPPPVSHWACRGHVGRPLAPTLLPHAREGSRSQSNARCLRKLVDHRDMMLEGAEHAVP